MILAYYIYIVNGGKEFMIIVFILSKEVNKASLKVLNNPA